MDPLKETADQILFSILKLQALLSAAINPVLQTNTTKECIQRETQNHILDSILQLQSLDMILVTN